MNVPSEKRPSLPFNSRVVKDQRYWLHKLATLRIDRARGNPAPHKPLLLLVILEMAEKGEIDQEIYVRQTRTIETYMERWSHVTQGDAIPHMKNQLGVVLAFEMYSIGNYSCCKTNSI